MKHQQSCKRTNGTSLSSSSFTAGSNSSSISPSSNSPFDAKASSSFSCASELWLGLGENVASFYSPNIKKNNRLKLLNDNCKSHHLKNAKKTSNLLVHFGRVISGNIFWKIFLLPVLFLILNSFNSFRVCQKWKGYKTAFLTLDLKKSSTSHFKC